MTVDTPPIATAAVAVDTDCAAMMAVPVGMIQLALVAPRSDRNVTPTDESSGRIVTLRAKFANWIAVSNRNRCLGLALALLYAIRRGLH